MWFVSDERLVLFNSKFVDYTRELADLIVPGARFEDLLRAGVAQGIFHETLGANEDWIERRLERHRNPGPPFEQRRADGRWLQISERKTPDGGTVGIRTDVTRIKEIEQELLRRQRLAALGQLTATVSHELRNPLSTIRASIFTVESRVAERGVDIERPFESDPISLDTELA